MIKSWIKELKADRKRYHSDLWQYRFSGNQLELIAIPHHKKDSDKYRLAIIGIGQVIQHVISHLEENDLLYLIQTLPQFENPQLIALIRITVVPESRLPETLLPLDDCSLNCLDKMMKSEASYHNLSLNKSSATTSKFESYLVHSKIDNPFIWLKTGYWIERVLMYIELCNFNNPPELNAAIDQRSRKKHSSNYYTQVIVKPVPPVKNSIPD